MFLSALEARKILGTSTDWILLEPLVYRYNSVQIVVPIGFKTDLSTNWIRGRHDHASVVHDYLLDEGHTYAYANDVMRQAMRESFVRRIPYAWISFWIGLNGFIKDCLK